MNEAPPWGSLKCIEKIDMHDIQIHDTSVDIRHMVLFYISSDAVGCFPHKVLCVSCLFKLIFKVTNFKISETHTLMRYCTSDEAARCMWNHMVTGTL